MRFLPPDKQIRLYEEGFSDDLFGRSRIGKGLSNLLENIEDPLVIALDGRWGTGKTYFLTRWVGAHRIQNDGKALTLYFDAFAHDYLTDPLIALVAALSDRLPKSEITKAARLKKAAFKFVKPAARLGLALATYGASEALSGVGDAAAEAIKGEGDRAIEGFWKLEQGRQAAMIEFQAAIELLTRPGGEGVVTPLIIVIDELDRCRPDYALELLEVIKHFFAVDNVHFILGVNLDALQNSVKVRYGSSVDAHSYLQKFLSLTFSLPAHIGDRERTPANVQYVHHLSGVMDIPSHLSDEIAQQISMIGANINISIRDIGKVMSAAALVTAEVRDPNMYEGWKTILVSLIISRVIDPVLFRKMIDSSITDTEIRKFITADEKRTEQKIGNDVNKDFNYNIAIRYYIWSYVICNGSPMKESYPNVGRMFDQFGSYYNAQSIPLTIHDKYLSTFKMS